MGYNILYSSDGTREVRYIDGIGFLFFENDEMKMTIYSVSYTQLKPFVSEFLESGWGSWSVADIVALINIDKYKTAHANRFDVSIYNKMKYKFFYYINRYYPDNITLHTESWFGHVSNIDIFIPFNVPIKECLGISESTVLDYACSIRFRHWSKNADGTAECYDCGTCDTCDAYSVVIPTAVVEQVMNSVNYLKTVDYSNTKSILKINAKQKKLMDEAALSGKKVVFRVNELHADGTFSGSYTSYYLNSEIERIICLLFGTMCPMYALQEGLFDNLMWKEI